MHQGIIKYVVIVISALFYFESNSTFADANVKISLGHVTSEELLSSQAKGTLIIDIRRQDEWLKRQNYFLEEQNKRLKIELSESKEYINVLINKLKIYQSKQ